MKKRPTLSLVEEPDYLKKMRAVLERLSDDGLQKFAEKLYELRDMPEAERSRQEKAESALRRKARVDRLKTARFGKIRLASPANEGKRS
jgi:hypothetical protein